MGLGGGAAKIYITFMVLKRLAYVMQASKNPVASAYTALFDLILHVHARLHIRVHPFRAYCPARVKLASPFAVPGFGSAGPGLLCCLEVLVRKLSGETVCQAGTTYLRANRATTPAKGPGRVFNLELEGLTAILDSSCDSPKRSM